MKIIGEWNITEEIEEALKNEPTCILSSDENHWLFTDMKVFNDFSFRFKFDIETEEREKIHSYGVEEYLLYRYDGGEGQYDYFGCYVELGSYREKVAKIAEKNRLGENWDIQLDKLSKSFAIEEIALKIQEIFDEMKSDGWNVDKLKSILNE